MFQNRLFALGINAETLLSALGINVGTLLSAPVPNAEIIESQP
jgi:hypothetical protein